MKNRINLLRQFSISSPTQISRRSPTHVPIIIIFAVILIGFEVAFLTTFYRNLSRTIMDAELLLSSLDQKETSLQRELAKLRTEVQTKSKQEPIVPKFQATSRPLLKALTLISEKLPNKTWIDTLSQKNNQLTIYGYATEHILISDYILALQASKDLKDVSLIKAEQVKEKNRTVNKFMITCDII